MADKRNIPTWNKLRELAAKSTEVVGWYAHGTGDGYHLGKASVRGPFGRWFIVEGGDNGMGDPEKYPTPVASLEDDANYCAAAMNSVPALLDELEEFRTMARDLALFVASLQVEHRFNQAENEWANRCLKPYNDYHATRADKP